MTHPPDIDLHDLLFPTLPEWGPDVPGTPVEVAHRDGSVALSYAWRDGRVTIAGPGRERETGPFSWGRCRITAVLADDPTHWPAVDADERVELGEHLVGARACSEWGGATTVGPAARVDEDGSLWAKEGHLIASPFDSLRVHPADLAAARAKATPPLPDEPPVGSVVLDCDGEAWLRNDEGWASANDAFFGWDDLRQYGPITVVHRAEP